MPPWIVKAAIQGVLSRLPNSQAYNHLFQKHVTRSVDLTETYFLSKFRQCERHLQELARESAGARPASFVALELGTGWFPIVPIGLALGGAHRVYSVDTQRLISHARVLSTLEHYLRCIETKKLQTPSADSESRVRAAIEQAPRLSAEALLAELGVEPLVADARALPLDAGSVDLICSNNTLEHIPRAVIVDILKEFRRVGSVSVLMSHHIDLADHYANFDKSISVYNFLKYSERTWRLFNNELQYQNRLRVSDFRAIHAEAGWQVLQELNTRKPEEVLKAIRLADEFKRYSVEDLLVYDSWFSSRPKAVD